MWSKIKLQCGECGLRFHELKRIGKRNICFRCGQKYKKTLQVCEFDEKVSCFFREEYIYSLAIAKEDKLKLKKKSFQLLGRVNLSEYLRLLIHFHVQDVK
jgi:hypothetical protein